MPLAESDKIVAATLAAAKAAAAGATTAEDYIAEYQGFLYHFEMRNEIAAQQAGDPFSPIKVAPKNEA
jgi:hypothetical protein